MQVGATKRELAEVEALLQTAAREKKRGELTRGELDGFNEASNMYQSVGECLTGAADDGRVWFGSSSKMVNPVVGLGGCTLSVFFPWLP